MDMYAGFFRRAGAYLMDVLVVLALLTPVWIWFIRGLVGPQSGGYLLGYSLFLPFIWVGARFFYLVLFWEHTGSSPGMKLFKIRLLRSDGRDVRWGAAVLRYIGFLICTATYGVGFLVALFTRQRQGLQDLIARTVVVPASVPISREES